MICHKRKIIFIHIPKCAGSSIFSFFHPKISPKWSEPHYDVLFGWCPKRKIHMQHATPIELIQTNLISKKTWNEYYKFTFVRNPWDRAYSDYLWFKMEHKINDTFKNFINRKGKFNDLLNDKSVRGYRGDHLREQNNYLKTGAYSKIDFVGRFEDFNCDIKKILDYLEIVEDFNVNKKKIRSKFKHYSYFYSNTKKRMISELYNKDIELLNYKFEDKKRGINKLKNLM